MPAAEENPAFALPHDSRFTTTHWSVVLAARGSDSSDASEALEKLCRAYWHPLYAFVRRRGYERHAAQDLTQEFFARLLEKNYLGAADRAKGKFRTFLLTALEHFLANEWRDAHAQKRGGKLTFLSFDDPAADEQYLQVSSGDLSPERLYEKQWAMTLLEQALATLQSEFAAAGKGPWFNELKIFLTGEKRSVSYADLAVKLATTEGALKTAVNRLRQRYAGLLREEVARTVASPDEVEEELRALMAALNA